MHHRGVTRRRTVIAGASALLAGSAFAQAKFPSRPITIYCPFTAGGTADVQLRAPAAAASRELAQAIVIAFVSTLEQLGQEPWGLGPQHYRDYMVSRIPVERELVARYRLREQ